VELATLFRIARILNLDLNKYANEINILDDLKSIDESKKQKLVNNQKAIL
jgi:hypothetical protein